MGLFDFLEFDVFAYFFSARLPDRWFFINDNLPFLVSGMWLCSLSFSGLPE